MSDLVSLVQSYLSENPWQALGQVVGTAFAVASLARGAWGNLANIGRGAAWVWEWAWSPSRTALLEQEVRRLTKALGGLPDETPVTGASTQGTVTGAAAGLCPSDGQRRPAKDVCRG